jgi:hypothetical protein
MSCVDSNDACLLLLATLSNSSWMHLLGEAFAANLSQAVAFLMQLTAHRTPFGRLMHQLVMQSGASVQAYHVFLCCYVCLVAYVGHWKGDLN